MWIYSQRAYLCFYTFNWSNSTSSHPGSWSKAQYLICLWQLSILQRLQFSSGRSSQDATQHKNQTNWNTQRELNVVNTEACISTPDSLQLCPKLILPAQSGELELLCAVNKKALQVHLADSTYWVYVCTGAVILGEITCKAEQEKWVTLEKKSNQIKVLV